MEAATTHTATPSAVSLPHAPMIPRATACPGSGMNESEKTVAPVQLVFGRLGSALFAVAFKLAWLGRIPSVDLGAQNRNDEAVAAARRFSSSDKAKSCLTISAFSHLSARLGLPRRFGARANTAIASITSATPTPAIEMPVMTRLPWPKWPKHSYRRHCALAGAAGYRLPRLLS